MARRTWHQGAHGAFLRDRRIIHWFNRALSKKLKIYFVGGEIKKKEKAEGRNPSIPFLKKYEIREGNN